MANLTLSVSTPDGPGVLMGKRDFFFLVPLSFSTFPLDSLASSLASSLAANCSCQLPVMASLGLGNLSFSISKIFLSIFTCSLFTTSILSASSFRSNIVLPRTSSDIIFKNSLAPPIPPLANPMPPLATPLMPLIPALMLEDPSFPTVLANPNIPLFIVFLILSEKSSKSIFFPNESTVSFNSLTDNITLPVLSTMFPSISFNEKIGFPVVCEKYPPLLKITDINRGSLSPCI